MVRTIIAWPVFVAVLATAFAPSAYASEWSELGKRKVEERREAAETHARANEEVARIRKWLGEVGRRVQDGSDNAEDNKKSGDRKMREMRHDILRGQIKAIMREPDVDAGEGIEAVNEITDNAIKTLESIGKAGGEANDWSEDYE